MKRGHRTTRETAASKKSWVMRWLDGTSIFEQWRQLRRGKPGHRFQDRYKRGRCGRSGRSTWGRVLRLIVGILALAVGVLFLVIPGPGLPIIVIGAAVLATESLWMARILDRTEVRCRPYAGKAQKQWERLPKTARLALAVTSTVFSVFMALALPRLLGGD